MSSLSWIDYLNDPQLVAKFQHFFGITTATTEVKKKSSTNNDIPNHSLTPRSSSSLPKNYTINLTNETHLRERVIKRTSADDNFPELGLQAEEPEPSESGISCCGSATNSNTSLSTNEGSSSGFGSSNDDEEAEEASATASKNTYQIGNKFWYYLFSFGSAMGDEIFYATFFPFWFWNIDGSIARRVVLIWGILMYIGQGLKDIIRWPRPACPPAVRLESKWALEYAMPSTHAIVASAVPFSVLYFTSSRYEYDLMYGLGFAIGWITLVGMSRIYLGMHSVLDILAGLGLVAISFSWVIPLVEWLDPILLKHQYGGFYLMLGAIVLVLCSPGGDRWTPARGDTVVILGSCVGLNMGAWMNYQLGIVRGPPLEPPYAVHLPSITVLGLCFLRLFLGLIVVYTSKVILKSAAMFALPGLLRSKTMSYVSTATRKDVIVELTYKFITYSSISFNVVFLSPVLFRFLGIERPTFYTEV